MNLSDYNLLPSDNELLHLGLSFIPSVHKIHPDTIRDSLRRLTRSIKLRAFFGDDRRRTTIPYNRLFIEKSTWIPPHAAISDDTKKLIKSLWDTTDKVVGRYPYRHPHFHMKDVLPNLTHLQRTSISGLRNNKSLIIKAADKGGLTCLLNRPSYLSEAYRQLNNPKYYARITTPRKTDNIQQINSILGDLHAKNLINTKQYDFLEAKECDKDRHFYLLPKVHKDICKWPLPSMPEGRPIVGDCSTESRRVSDFIDFHLKPLSVTHASYVKDSYDFVSRVRNTIIPPNALLVTGDVTALYTNMNLNRSIAVVKRALAENPRPNRPDKQIIQLLDLTLRNNDFRFNEEIFLQKYGTAMGKTYAPSLANLYLVDFDKQASRGFRIQPLLYLRFLDDVFFIWPGTMDELREFENFLNSIIPDIKITLTAHETEVNFLDTTVFKHPTEASTTLQTKVFFKPTDTHQLLHTNSFHPPHTTPGILKSQIIRFQRLSSFKTDFDHSCLILFKVLRTRGYNNRLLRRTKHQIWHNYNRQTKAPLNQPVLPIVMAYSPLASHLMREWKKLLHKSPLFKKHRIIAAYCRHRNLAEMLTSSKLRPTTGTPPLASSLANNPNTPLDDDHRPSTSHQ